MWENLHRRPTRIKKDNTASYPANLEEIYFKKETKKSTCFPYLAAVCFLPQKGSAHTLPLHSGSFLYQTRWPFWSKWRNTFFPPDHGCSGWECKGYWAGILLTPLWTKARCVPPDMRLHFLHSWIGENTGKSLTHPGRLICFVSLGENLDLCSLWGGKKRIHIILEIFTRTNPGMAVRYHPQSKMFHL